MDENPYKSPQSEPPPGERPYTAKEWLRDCMTGGFILLVTFAVLLLGMCIVAYLFPAVD